MLQQFILGFLLITLNACTAQKDTKMKTFDIENFNKNKNHLNHHSFIKNDSTSVKQSRWQFGFEEIITKKDNLISTYYKYYESGKLKIEGDFFPNDFEKGIWKEYDEQGKILKETNYDALYKFTWEDILEFITKRKIDINGNNFEVGRNIVEGRPVWGITYNKKETDMLSMIGIYGDNGELFQESEIDAPIEEEYDTLPDMENE